MKNCDKLPDDLKGVDLEVALSECYERMNAIGVSTAEKRAREVLLGLGFKEDMIHRPTAQLSGGWAMRAALGAGFFFTNQSINLHFSITLSLLYHYIIT